jgi:glutathione synthase/RimK-type ligase-like ATP-grasp enzyme
VLKALEVLSVEPVLLDTAALESTSFAFEDDVLRLESEEGEPLRIKLGAPTRGWIRRLAPPHWRRGIQAGTEQAAVRSAWTALLSAIASAAEVSWLTPLESLFLRENKLVQAATANRLGIQTPRTVVVSDHSQIPAELGQEFVVKPLGASTFSGADGVEQVVWSQGVSRDSAILDLLPAAPFILQARLEALRHLRVVTVSNQTWACELAAEGLPLDWRRDESAHDSFLPVSHPELERQALRLAASLDLGYSSQDWIETEGGSFFIDLNPAGQWMFLPQDTSTAITEAIATWLIDR